MDLAIDVARWVVGKALGPVADSVLEAWAASAGLGDNVDALTTELLKVQATLDGTSGRAKDNQALEALLRMLRDLAYDAGDVLDELDYFRIQDGLDGTSEAADEDGLVLNARHTAKAAVGKLLRLPCGGGSPALATPAADEAAGEVDGCARKLASGARNTVRAVGKCFPCSSLPPVRDDDSDGEPDFLAPRAAMLEAPQQGKRVEKTPKLVFNRVEISRKMAFIVDNIRSLRRDVSEILGPIGSRRSDAPYVAQSRPVTTSRSIEPELHGRDTIMNSIIHDITKGVYCDKGLTVLPIVGPGGIGKTTLTQYIYHKQEVQNHFDVTVWICVSLNFEANKLIEDIEKHIPKVDGENDIDTAADRIEKRLKSKRFLLILDDMWECRDEDEWKRLLLPFRNSRVKGNIILVTTRLPTLAKMVKTSDQYIELNGLESKAFKELFLAFVFDNEQPRNEHNMLLEVADDILDKLKGSPLAAKTVGRLLRNNLDLNHWLRVLEDKKWESQEGNYDIMPALKLSYDYLPFHLQQCFSCCALFPKDYKFGSKELIYFWIGLNVLPSSHQNRPIIIEEKGQECLNDLVSYGFFKEEEENGSPFYLIHDLLHDLALKVSYECLVSIDRSNVRSLDIGPAVRHLSITVDCAEDSEISSENFISKLNAESDSDGIRDENFIGALKELTARLKIENIHTLMISGRLHKGLFDFFRDLIRKAKGLRVLHLSRLSGHYWVEESILHNIPTLLHLRYLSQPQVPIVHHLPSMISRLYHLIILDLQKWRGSYDLLSDISSLRKLRHVVVFISQDHSKICNVGKLQFLQELEKFEVNKDGRSGFGLKQLGNLIELRELGIYNLEKIHTEEEAAEAKLIDKTHLLELTLVWDHVCPKEERDVGGDVLEGLRPHRNLQKLSIRGHGSSSCPKWLGSELCVKYLRSLHLARVDWEVLPLLGRMGMLHDLSLEHMPNLKEFGPGNLGSITEQPFCNLKTLKLSCLRGLEKWVTWDHCDVFFSQLEVLTICDCPNLSGLPFPDSIYYSSREDQEDSKVHWFPNLRELQIEKCPKVASLPPIPWTQTLCSVNIDGVGSSIVGSLEYRSEYGFLEMWGEDRQQVPLDNKVFEFNNLKDLRVLSLWGCPPLEYKNLQKLTSLKRLYAFFSAFMQSIDECKVKWQIPIVSLEFNGCLLSGKELTQLLSHLPKLSELKIIGADKNHKIAQMGVEVDQQHVPQSSASAVRFEEDTQAERKSQQEIAEKADETEKTDDGLLLFPAHLSDSLKSLMIYNMNEVSLLSYPSPSDDYQKERRWQGRGLQDLRSLQYLRIQGCPKFFSIENISFPSTCFPFPSSLKTLIIWETEGLGTLECLSNLTSLTELRLDRCGEDLTGEGLRPLLTHGQLSKLEIKGSPKLEEECRNIKRDHPDIDLEINPTDSMPSWE